MGIKVVIFKTKKGRIEKGFLGEKGKVGVGVSEEAVGKWSYMGSCKGSLKGEVWKGRGRGFEQKHSNLKKEKAERKKKGDWRRRK